MTHGTRTTPEAPRFSLAELGELRDALSNASLYVGPVGLSDHAAEVWRKAKHWRDRIESLIAETGEWEAEYGD